MLVSKIVKEVNSKDQAINSITEILKVLSSQGRHNEADYLASMSGFIEDIDGFMLHNSLKESDFNIWSFLVSCLNAAVYYE